LKRHQRVVAGCSLPLTLADSTEVIAAAIRMLPETLQAAVENQQGSDGEQLIRVWDRVAGADGRDSEQSSQIIVKCSSVPAEIPWPLDSTIPPAPIGEVEQRTEWFAYVILGTTVEITILHGERAHDIDLEQAIQQAILGEMYELGLVSRDEYGRYVDDNENQLWP
jgi:hypothetical protein